MFFHIIAHNGFYVKYDGCPSIFLTDYLLPMSFSAKLIQIRKSQGLTQKALSESADLHINQIRRYEAGTSEPTLGVLIKLAKFLHVSIKYDGCPRK